jgi:hypothetical protein
MKKIAVFVLFIASYFLLPGSTKASLVRVGESGDVIVKVLSSEDSIALEIPQSDYLEVKNIAKEIPDPESKISLVKDNGEIMLKVATKSGEKSLDVTNYEDEVIEIEERPQTKKVAISITDNKFIIKQGGVSAVTDYEINIDPASARLTLATKSGLKFLSILPRQAVETMLRSKLVSRLNRQDRFEITEEEGGELAYVVSGEKTFNVFQLFEYAVPVVARVSASTGEILEIEQPQWLNKLNFLFV